MAMTLVSTTTVGSGGASAISFQNIPQTGKDLLLLFSIRSATSSSPLDGQIRINSLSSFTYNDRTLRGSGSAVTSRGDLGANGYINWDMPGNNLTSNTFANGSFYLANYTASIAKAVSMDVVYENNATAAYQNIYAGEQPTTNAVTRIDVIDPTGGSFRQYSTASLYIIS